MVLPLNIGEHCEQFVEMFKAKFGDGAQRAVKMWSIQDKRDKMGNISRNMKDAWH